jgi:IS66 C-terminal element
MNRRVRNRTHGGVGGGRCEVSPLPDQFRLWTDGHKRKNYLFCGSDAGGQRAACVYTIVESAKMCGINPQAYLADVLERIADHPIHKIDALLPWLWTQ